MNPYPTISQNSDTGALIDMSNIEKFVSDTISLSGLIATGVLVGGGALIGGKKHRLLGAGIGLGLQYALWLKGSSIVAARK